MAWVPSDARRTFGPMADSKPLTWEQLEEPVLRWVADPANERVDFEWAGATSPLAPQLSDTEVNGALLRLQQHELIRGEYYEGSGASWWSGLRATADGLRVLGEWPPAREASVQDVLVLVLRELGHDLPDGDASTVRRAGSAVAKSSSTALAETAKGVLRRGGEGVVS